MIETTVAPVIDADLLALVLDHVKVETGDEQTAYGDLVEAYLEAAIGRIESASGRCLFTRTMELTTDAFGTALIIPVSPVISVASITYVDLDGVTQTLSSSTYSLINRLETPAIFPVHGAEFPKARDYPGSITVTLDAGYGEDVADIPSQLRMAVMQTVADWFRFGGNVATTSVMELPASARHACMNFRRQWA
ncbi:head-tail connector protein [Hoeflea sp.]|uniref:head-tail connector protein n=1 Tax=Hoeflea sp. TaxID=1940281 RepID=UPI003B51D438